MRGAVTLASLLRAATRLGVAAAPFALLLIGAVAARQIALDLIVLGLVGLIGAMGAIPLALPTFAEAWAEGRAPGRRRDAIVGVSSYLLAHAGLVAWVAEAFFLVTLADGASFGDSVGRTLSRDGLVEPAVVIAALVAPIPLSTAIAAQAVVRSRGERLHRRVWIGWLASYLVLAAMGLIAVLSAPYLREAAPAAVVGGVALVVINLVIGLLAAGGDRLFDRFVGPRLRRDAS